MGSHSIIREVVDATNPVDGCHSIVRVRDAEKRRRGVWKLEVDLRAASQVPLHEQRVQERVDEAAVNQQNHDVMLTDICVQLLPCHQPRSNTPRPLGRLAQRLCPCGVPLAFAGQHRRVEAWKAALDVCGRHALACVTSAANVPTAVKWSIVEG